MGCLHLCERFLRVCRHDPSSWYYAWVLVLLTWSMAMPPGVQAFRRSFAGTLQIPSLDGKHLLVKLPCIRHLLSQVWM
jgi:hypothetical protein